MQKKKNCMVRIDAEVLKQAKEQGYNISKVCENALKQKLSKENREFLGEASFKKKVLWCGRRDLNPSTRLGKPGS